MGDLGEEVREKGVKEERRGEGCSREKERERKREREREREKKRERTHCRLYQPSVPKGSSPSAIPSNL